MSQSIRYYAVALNPDGRVGLLLVLKAPGVPGGVQTWTGDTWPNTAAGNREAMAETGRLNAMLAATRRAA